MPPDENEKEVEKLNEELAKQFEDKPATEAEEAFASGEKIRITLDDEEGDEAPPAEDEGAQPSRRDKKRERGRLREEAEAAKRENAELRERLARIEGRMDAQPAARREEPGEDPLERAWKQHKEETKQFSEWWESVKANADDATRKRAEDRAWELRRREMALGAAEHQRRTGPRPEDTRRQAVVEHIRLKYPDVVSSPKRDQILRYAGAVEAQKIATGTPESLQLLEESMEEARKAFGLAAPPPPSDATRRRHTSQPRRAGTSTDGPRQVELTKADRKMALERFRPEIERGEISEKQAMQKYYRRYMEKGA